jgi:hypothetical protein
LFYIPNVLTRPLDDFFLCFVFLVARLDLLLADDFLEEEEEDEYTFLAFLVVFVFVRLLVLS